MENDTFNNIWKDMLETNGLHKNPLYDATNLLNNMLETTNGKTKTQSLILNSFLNFFTNKNFSYSDISKANAKNHIIVKILLNDQYFITPNDEAVFLYGQFLFTEGDKLVQKEKNLSNENYHYFIKKNNIIIEKLTFDTLFESAIKMFPRNQNETFEQINSYIEKNKSLWDENINKNKKLLQKYNNQILTLLNQYQLYTNPSYTEPLKKFLKLSRMTMDGIHHHQKIIDTFVPWFLKHSSAEQWDDFTKMFSSKDQALKDRIAAALIVYSNKKHEHSPIRPLLVLENYKEYFFYMITENISNDKIIWFNKNIFTTALNYANQQEQTSKKAMYYITKNTTTSHVIPEKILGCNIKLSEWLLTEKLLSQQQYDNIVPKLTAYNLEQTIQKTDIAHKKHKI